MHMLKYVKNYPQNNMIFWNFKYDDFHNFEHALIWSIYPILSFCHYLPLISQPMLTITSFIVHIKSLTLQYSLRFSIGAFSRKIKHIGAKQIWYFEIGNHIIYETKNESLPDLWENFYVCNKLNDWWIRLMVNVKNECCMLFGFLPHKRLNTLTQTIYHGEHNHALIN